MCRSCSVERLCENISAVELARHEDDFDPVLVDCLLDVLDSSAEVAGLPIGSIALIIEEAHPHSGVGEDD